jgi:hypothetical protein
MSRAPGARIWRAAFSRLRAPSASASERAHHHHRFVAGQRQVEEIGGLVEGVGAVQDDGADDLGAGEQLGHIAAQARPQGRPHGSARHVGEFHHLDPREVRKARHGGGEVRPGQGGDRRARDRIVLHRDGAAGGDDGDDRLVRHGADQSVSARASSGSMIGMPSRIG